jgi:hypothetical protein
MVSKMHLCLLVPEVSHLSLNFSGYKLTTRRICCYHHRAHQGGCRGWSYPLYRHLPWYVAVDNVSQFEADVKGYFAFAMGNDRQSILGFFKKVLDASPIPVMIYNFP